VNDIPIARRFVLALTGVLVGGYLLRPQVSEALVIRGDERLYRGSAADAMIYYRRAIEADPLDGAAVDRLLFGAISLRDRRIVRDAIQPASAYLRRRPNDDVVRMDRAMAFRLLGDWGRAADDFQRAGLRERDATALTFAGYAALAMHQKARALALWRSALSVDSRFVAARHALRARTAAL
jgi:tetratricopeptide (TPR) repeat protein